MLCEAFIIAWNERDTIEFTVKHYQKLCNKITVFDNYSSDGTDIVASELGCHVLKFGIEGQLSDKFYLQIKNNCWKKSDARWVIVVDCDEILDVSRETLHQADADGNSIFKTYGWQVFSNDMPRFEYSELTNGFHDPNYSKLCIFDPKQISDINYVYGCHVAAPKGRLSYSDKTLTLFHYRNIGGVQRLVNRHRQYRKRLSELNRRMGLGIHYTYDDERRIREWQEQFGKSKLYSPGGI